MVVRGKGGETMIIAQKEVRGFLGGKGDPNRHWKRAGDGRGSTFQSSPKDCSRSKEEWPKTRLATSPEEGGDPHLPIEKGQGQVDGGGATREDDASARKVRTQGKRFPSQSYQTYY